MATGHQVEVSIIIPVYNTYEWFDQCMESVVNQTFSDFEVLLMDDSTDKTSHKCKEWEEKDSRIRYFHGDRKGPSLARNKGISLSSGVYLAFIDSDDWIDHTFLEKLLSAIKEKDADIAECDVFRFNELTQKATLKVCSGNMGMDYSLEEHMKYGYTAIWKCLIKKDLFVSNQIWFPDCGGEARAIYALLLAKSRGIVNVHEGLYYYRILREGSLTNNTGLSREKDSAIGIQALEELIEGFKRLGLYARYEDLLSETVKLKLSDRLAGSFYRKSREEYDELWDNYSSYCAAHFANNIDYSYFTIGGYNLDRIVMHMGTLHNPAWRFNFTGIISMMHPISGLEDITHPNKYRERMIRRDICSSIWEYFEQVRPNFVIIDFIDERFDVLQINEGFLTISDAFEEAQTQLERKGRRYTFGSDEYFDIWKEACKGFICRLKDYLQTDHIILVKNFLSEQVGELDEQEEYENIEEIRHMNDVLKLQYDFFAGECGETTIVEATQQAPYFTDKKYQYGAIPSHLNEIVNKKIAEMIEKECKRMIAEKHQ